MPVALGLCSTWWGKKTPKTTRWITSVTFGGNCELVLKKVVFTNGPFNVCRPAELSRGRKRMDEVAAAVHTSSQRDHKNSAASVLILASPPFPLVFTSLCVGLVEGIRIRRVGPLSGAHLLLTGALCHVCPPIDTHQVGAGRSCSISTLFLIAAVVGVGKTGRM